MSYKKYLQDYRVEEYTDNKGRVRSTAVYIGGGYILSPDISVRDRRFVLAASILCWLALIGALLPRTSAVQMLYVIYPFTFSALPLYLVTGAAVELLFAEEKMKRERAEKISNRLPSASFFTALLSAAAFLGFTATAVFRWQDMLSGDMLFCAFSLVFAAAATFVFFKCRAIKAVKADND